MKLIQTTNITLTKSNIPDLYPEWNSYFSYQVEPYDTPTYDGVARIDDSLYRSTTDDNIGNDPLDLVHWSYSGVSNKYAMLDFDGNTKTQFTGDGEVEFIKGIATTLMIGFIAGCGNIEVDTLAPTGSEEFIMYEECNVGSDSFSQPYSITSSGSIVFVGDRGTGEISSFDATDPSNMVELQAFSSVNISTPRVMVTIGSVLFVIDDSTNKLVSINATDPSNMVELQAFSSANISSPEAMIAIDDTIFVLNDNGAGLISIDASNASSMVELQAFTSVNIDIALSLTSIGNTVFVGDSSSSKLVSINATDPSNMVELQALNSANIGLPNCLTSIGSTVFVGDISTEKLTSFDATDPSNMVELQAFSDSEFSDIIAIGNIDGKIFVLDLATEKLIAIDATNPSVMVKLESFGSASFAFPTLLAISEIAIFIVDTHTDKLISIHQDYYSTIDSQTKTLYGDKTTAAKFDLPTLGEIVRVKFNSANGQDVEVGTMYAGVDVEMGKTLIDVSFKPKPTISGYVKEASFKTIVDKANIPQTIGIADKSTNVDSGFIIDPEDSSSYQNLMILGQLKETPVTLDNNDIQEIGWTVVGEPFINYQPLGVDANIYSKIGFDGLLTVVKGSGGVYSERSTAGGYINEYDDYIVAEVDEARFEEEGFLSESASTNLFKNDQEDPSTYIVTSTTYDSTLNTQGFNLGKFIPDVGTGGGDVTGVKIYATSGLNTEVFSISCILKYVDIDVVRVRRVDLDQDIHTIATINLKTGEIVSSDPGTHRDIVFKKINGAYLFEATYALTADSDHGYYFQADDTAEATGTSSFYIGAVQIEKLPFSTSYIKDNTERAGDETYFDTQKNIPNLQEDWSIKWIGTPAFTGSLTLQYIIYNKCDNDNKMMLYSNRGKLNFRVVSNGIAKTSSCDIEANEEIEAVLSCENGIVSLYVDGILKDTDDFSTVLDIPIHEKTYLNSNEEIPNTEFKVHTKILEFYDKAIK